MRNGFHVMAAWLLAAAAGAALAQRGEETLALMPEGAQSARDVSRLIELPRNAAGDLIPAVQGLENGANGLAIANEAREAGRAFGEAMAAQAQENRENNARGGPPDLTTLPPGQVPGDVTLPPLPELPEPPVTPPAPERPESAATPAARP